MTETKSEQSIFLAALELKTPAERAAFLKGACADDEALFANVKSLLAHHEKGDEFLDRPPVESTAAYRPIREGPGAIIGPYKLMEQIGEGGMGLVFVAEQAQPVRRKVALKIIKPGMDTSEVIARFEAERQALAMMDHPNIAKVFDAGLVEAHGQPSVGVGRPYFVMELVRGVPITEYCDAHNLSPKERLALFVQVCNAVQHAHHKAIIHRDLKPTNIMVAPHDGVPVVKVIDFGVAKALGQQLTEKTLYTRFAQMVGTPLYMSPEQAEVNQLDVDTRSDVYSLGVLLYELLTSTTPFDRARFQTAAYDEIRRIIKEEEPPKPSTRLTSLGATIKSISAHRGTDPARLSNLVRGELDWIVMRCLEKDRTRRYDSAAGLAKDVQRYLSDEPVEARPVSVWYRLQKSYRRNRAAVAIVGGFAALLLIGLVLVTWKWQDERAARADADTARRDAVASAKQLAEDADRMNAANAAMDLGDYHVNFFRWADADAEFTKATALRKDHSSVWMRRARFYADLGLWDLAAADSKRAFALREPDASLEWNHHALLLLEAGETEAYHRLCRRMLDRFGESTDRHALGGMVSTWALAGKEPSVCLHVARLYEERVPATGAGRPGSAAFFLGTAYYRSGQFEEAIRYLRQSLTDTTWSMRAINHPVLAMALRQQGQHDEARQELANARKVLEGWTQKAFDARNEFVPVSLWRDWARYQQFYREAHTLIEGVPPQEDPRLRVVRGRAFAALGRLDQAASEYATAVRLPGAGFPIRAESFRFFASAQRWSEAEAELTALMTLKPNDPQVHLEAFRAFADNGNWNRATAEHAAAMRLKPDDIAIRLERFRYHVERAEMKEAEAAYADAIKDRAADTAFRIKCGDFCATLKQWGKARDEYLRILDAGTLGDGVINRDTWLRLAGLQLYLDDVEGYRRTCVRLVEQHESSSDFRIRVALIRICLLHPDPGVPPTRLAQIRERFGSSGDDHANGLHAAAIVSLRLGKDNVDLQALQNALNKRQWPTQRIALARVCHARGDFHSARLWMNQVNVGYRRVDPTVGGTGKLEIDLETQLWYRQAEEVIQSERWRAVHELMRQQQWATAIEALAPLLKPENKSAIDWGGRGACFAALGRWKEAAADFAHAYSLGRDYLPGYRMHGLVALQTGDRETYLRLCRDAIERFGDSTDRNMLNTVAWFCALDAAAEPLADQALKLMDKALSKSNYNTYVHTRACLLYRAKRYDEALKQLNELIVQPGYSVNAYDWLFLAMSSQQLGQKEKAREHLDKSVAWIVANPRQDWQQRLELERFRAEAEALIGPKK